MTVRLLGPVEGAPSPPTGTSGFNRGRVKLLGPVEQDQPVSGIKILGSVGQVSQPEPTGMFAIGTAKAPEVPKMKIGDVEIPVTEIPDIEKNGSNAERLLLSVEQMRASPEKFGLSTKQTWEDYALERAPFYAHGLIDKTRAAKDAAVNLESSERMDDDSISNLAKVIVKQEFEDKEESEKGILQRGLDVASYVPGLAAEVMLTMGAASAGKAVAGAAVKKGLKAILPVFVSQALESASEKLASRAAGRVATAGVGMLATSAAAAHLNIYKNKRDVAERMLPTVQGQEIVPGESYEDAYFNNSVDKTIEMLTEQLGGAVIGKAMSALGGGRVAGKLQGLPGVAIAKGIKNTTAKWLAERAGLKVPDALKVLADKTKYHGLLGEMMEERYGEGMRGVADAFLETDIGDDNGGVSGNLGLAAYQTLRGEYGPAADHLVGALGQLAVEGIGFGVVGGAGRAAGLASRAGGLGYDHSPEYAQQWAQQNQEAAQLLAQREPESLSRSLFASLGLPATIGKEKRKEFATWLNPQAAVPAGATPQAAPVPAEPPTQPPTITPIPQAQPPVAPAVAQPPLPQPTAVAASAESGPVSKLVPKSPPKNSPQWLVDNMEQDYAIAEKRGVVETILEQSIIGRKIAGQVVLPENLGTAAERREMVRLVRAMHGIPSQEAGEQQREFEALRSRVVGQLSKAPQDAPIAAAEVGEPVVNEAAAFHGTPHNVDKFSTSKIGTGEGAQAYGHGLYFAGDEGIARYYKKTLGDGSVYIKDDDGEFNASKRRDTSDAAQAVLNSGGNLDNALIDNEVEVNHLKQEIELSELADLDMNAKAASRDNREKLVIAEKVGNMLRAWKKRNATVRVANKGNVYKVDLKPSDDEYLNLDKTLDQQSDKVKSALAKAGFKTEPWVDEMGSQRLPSSKQTGQEIYSLLASEYSKLGGSPSRASEFLKSLGIRGNTYLDGNSRAKGSGYHNYVIFDDADVEIVETRQAKKGLPKPTQQKASTGLPKPQPKPSHSAPQHETHEGKKLAKEIAKKDTAVGTRSIAEFMAEGLHALMVMTKSQLTRKNPAHYKGAYRNKKGQAVTPPIHAILLKDSDGQIDFHELGHAMSAMFENVNPQGYAKWQAFWKDKLTELSNQGYSSVSGSLEEGVAEMLRLYMNDAPRLESMEVQTSNGKKTLLDGLEELLAGIGAEETAVIRDTRKLFEAHRSKSLIEQKAIFDRDKGYSKPFKGKAKQVGRNALAALFSKVVHVEGVIKDSFSELSGTEQSGAGNVTAMLKLLPVVSKLFGLKHRDVKRANKQARKDLAEIKADGGDIQSAHNNVARLQLEVNRVVNGTDLKQKGLRVIASNVGIDVMHEMAAAGLPSPTAAAPGEYSYIMGQDGKHIKLHHEIKEEVGEENWELFKTYGKYKTVDARYRATEERQAKWDAIGGDKGPRPEDYRYPEKDSHPIEDIRSMVAEVEKEHPSFVESYHDEERLFDGLLVIDVMSGEVPIEEAVKMKNAYSHYWALGRLQRGDAGYREGIEKLEITSGLERSYGSELPFGDVDDIMHSRVNRTLTAYNYNRLLDAAINFTRAMAKRTPKFRDRVRWMQSFIKLKVDLDPMKINGDEHRQILADHLNDLNAREQGYSNKEEMEADMPGSLLKPKDVDLRGPGDITLWRATAPRMANVIARKVQGKMEYFYVPQQFWLDILTSGGSLSQNSSKMSAILGILGAMTKPLSKVITRSLPFAIFNTFYRDPKTAMTTGQGKGALVPLYYTYTALKGVVHGWTGTQTDAEKEAFNEVFAMYNHATSPMNAFGQSLMGVLKEGIFTDQDGNKIRYAPSQVGWPKTAQSVVGAMASIALKPIDLANWASGGWWLSPKGEALTRIGAYIDSRNQGATQEQAIMAADNSTANFNQRSSNPLFLMADKQAMFFNARMQVRWQFYRQLFHPDPHVRGMAYLKMFYSGALHAAVLPTIVLALTAIGDDETDKWLEAWLKQEDERTDSDKARLGSIPLRNGLQLKIPFDDGPASMFDSMAFNTSLAWLAGAKTRGETLEQASASMIARLTQITGPGLSQLINPIIRTGIESEINFEFYNNRRIIPDGIASIYEKKQQTTPSTPESWNQLAEWLDTYGIEWSPMKIRHIVNNVGLKYIDQIAAYADNKSPKEMGNLPMFGQLFTKEPRGFSSQPVLSLSEMERKFDSAKKELEKIVAGGDEARAQEAARMLISLHGYKAWDGVIDRQWRQAKVLRNSGKVEEAMAMERLMTETARRGLKQAALQEAEFLKQGG